MPASGFSKINWTADRLRATWQQADLGESLKADMGSGFLPYRVQRIEPGRVWIVETPPRAGHAERFPSYPRPRDGRRITVRYHGDESAAVVVAVDQGLIEIISG